MLQRQIWSCLDSTDCVGASRIQAAGNPGCERLPNFRAPPSGVPVACCLTYLPGDDGGGAFGLNQCGNMPGESGSFGEQHFRFVPVAGGGQDGPRRFAMQLAAPLPQGPQCVAALQPGYATPKTLQTYQNWSLNAFPQTTPPVAPRRRRSLLQTAPKYTLRVESTDSTNMVVWQLEAFVDGGQNILQHCSMSRPWLSGAEQKKANCISDGRAYNSRKRRYFLVFIGFARLANQIIIAVQT